MTRTTDEAAGAAARLRASFASGDGSTRVQSAMTAGTYPRPEYIPVLIAQCAVEPDFTVRETLTWALVRHEPEATLEPVLAELRSPVPQARRQALHTLSKIGDQRAWPHITSELLDDDDPEVRTTAWRAAAGLAPDAEKAALAGALSPHFGEGTDAVRRSLTRAFAVLGAAARDAVAEAAASEEWDVRLHALATERVMNDPEADFDEAWADARRAAARRDGAEWTTGGADAGL